MAVPAISIPRETLENFCLRHHVRRLALFGSVLRDDFSPQSDIDILVVFEPEARVSFLTLGQMKRELSDLFGRTIDLVPQAGLKPVIREEVLSSAVEVYAA